MFNLMRLLKTCSLLVLTLATTRSQTAVNLSHQAKEADFRGFEFTRTIKTGTVLPATCTIGDLFLLTPATAGKNFYFCRSENTWSLQGGEAASQAEAEQGLDDTKVMTPLRTSQAIAARKALPEQAGNSGALLTTNGTAASWTRRLTFAPLTEAISTAAHTISTERSYMQVNPSADTTLTSAPTLVPGSDGQFLTLTNISPSFTLTLQDQGALPGSGLRLPDDKVTLAPLSSIYLVYNASASAWLVVSGAGGASSVMTKGYIAARCQNTVASAGFSLPSSGAPLPVCDAGAATLFGALRFTEANQSAQDTFPLPPAFAEMSVVMTARTSSTSGNSVFGLETACVGDNEAFGTGGTEGPSWNPVQTIAIPARTAALRSSISAETLVTTTGCEANEMFLFRISRHTSTTTTNPELLSLSFKVQ